MDAGELHLFAWLLREGDLKDFFISTADKAAVVAARRLDTLTSLYKLAGESGVSKKQQGMLWPHFCCAWLSKVKTNIHLGGLG